MWGPGSIPDQGTKIPQAAQPGKKKKKYIYIYIKIVVKSSYYSPWQPTFPFYNKLKDQSVSFIHHVVLICYRRARIGHLAVEQIPFSQGARLPGFEPALLLTNWVTLGDLLSFSGPQFSYLWKEGPIELKGLWVLHELIIINSNKPLRSSSGLLQVLCMCLLLL